MQALPGPEDPAVNEKPRSQVQGAVGWWANKIGVCQMMVNAVTKHKSREEGFGQVWGRQIYTVRDTFTERGTGSKLMDTWGQAPERNLWRWRTSKATSVAGAEHEGRWSGRVWVWGAGSCLSGPTTQGGGAVVTVILR